MWMPNNKVLQNAGVQDTKDRVLTYLDTLVGDTAPRARRKASSSTLRKSSTSCSRPLR